MIEVVEGNLLTAEVDALVNTVNTVGVMGKGVALQFKQAFPDNFKSYKHACDRGEVRPGEMFVWDSGRLGPQRYVINFPTKRHWRGQSRMADIDSGLHDLVRVIRDLHITSVAVPALGCGNGGLDWAEVRPRIEAALATLPVRVLLFPPSGAPAPRQMLVRTRRPAMTFGRAALIGVVAQYARRAMSQRMDLVRPGASLLEIQKLMYFLQEAGQPLRLRFAKGRYGPYAENLQQVLQLLEGHYLRGYGDRSQSVLALDPIEVLPGAEDDAAAWLAKRPDVRADVERVLTLVDGWEDAYGLELLGTVLYAARTEAGVAADPELAVKYVHDWNARKQSTFPARHVQLAWRRLEDLGWLTAAA
jgi:O-acetyl-ADP-ribose deacetylase (regulator of RNase III)